MNKSERLLEQQLHHIADFIAQEEQLQPEHYSLFLQEPELANALVDCLGSLADSAIDENNAYYSACVFALEICVYQLQSNAETSNKNAEKKMMHLMDHLATIIDAGQHSLSFWLPILNAFYEVHVELSAKLKTAYFNLANEEPDDLIDDIAPPLETIRQLITDLTERSDFDIAEHFFAQSYAMPDDFFADLMIDLYQIEEGKDIALLMLLHPKASVREVAIVTMDALIDTITLSSKSLTRLQAIKPWYPESYHPQFNQWIKIQRKKGVVFSTYLHKRLPHARYQASEIDGSGAQGIFIDFPQKKRQRLCGLLLKKGVGIKDAWITSVVDSVEARRYRQEAFDESIMLKPIDATYLSQLTNHFLALNVEQGQMPNLHLLEIQELLQLAFVPKRLDTETLLRNLTVQISPFTPEQLQTSLKRSKRWLKIKRFAYAWFSEQASIDKLVNRHCYFKDGIKVCDSSHAVNDVLTRAFESERASWFFHFLWVALWLKTSAKPHEYSWQDSVMIAYAIHDGMLLKDIPIMKEIAKQTVLNSMATMQERRTYLAEE